MASPALAEWLAAMDELCPNPKLGQIVVLRGNVYKRAETEVGFAIWSRLPTSEVLRLVQAGTFSANDLMTDGIPSKRKSVSTSPKLRTTDR